MLYQLSSPVRPRNGLATTPSTQPSDVSGFSLLLPPVMTESWSVGAVCEPAGGTPCARQLVFTAASLLKRRACLLWIEQGSSIAESKRDSDPNSSPIVGARKPCAQEARNRSACTGFQLSCALKVVCEPEVE